MAVRSEEAEELEGELKELEEDFAAGTSSYNRVSCFDVMLLLVSFSISCIGELTEKGYEKRKKVIILKKELLEGGKCFDVCQPDLVLLASLAVNILRMYSCVVIIYTVV